MSSRSEERASRAEARRRARLAARGELPEPDETEAPATDETERGGGFLRRIFPPAPPLPGRHDPLAGFDPDGPMRPLRERLFLLRRSPVPWIVTGLVAAIGLYASFFYQANLIGTLATFIQFGALIAAGWFGWQRPTLFGTAAGVLSGVLTAGLVLIGFASIGAPPETFGTGAVLGQAVLTVAYQAAFGFLGGWYGGYLRRRQAQLSRTQRSR